MKNKTYNAANEEQVKSSIKKEQNQRDMELEDIRQVLNNPHGLRLMKRIMEEGYIFRSTFTGNSWTFFNEGNRNLALLIFNDICEAAPDKVAKIMIRGDE